MSQSNSSQWNLGRFVQTLAYFDAVPFLNNFNWLSRMFSEQPATKSDMSFYPNLAESVLVVGATDRVGQKIVEHLLTKGYQVRALVLDSHKAAQLFSHLPQDRLKIVEIDQTKPDSLKLSSEEKLRAIIYNPCAENSSLLFSIIPNLLETAASHLSPATTKTIFDFTYPSPSLKDLWGALDDVVMGGVSESNLLLADGTAVFSGNVSTANSGGFASVRTRNFTQPLDIKGYEGIELRVRGDGNRYKFMVRAETRWDGIAYCYSFDTEPNRWMDIRIPFHQLQPVFRAKTVKNAEPLDLGSICAFQLMLSKFEYDGALNPQFRAGFFQIQLQSIKAYSGQTLPQFIVLKSPAENLTSSEWLDIQTKLQQSHLPYTVIQARLGEEKSEQSLVLVQSDEIGSEVNSAHVADVCIAALNQPQASYASFTITTGASSCAQGDWDCLFRSLQPHS